MDTPFITIRVWLGPEIRSSVVVKNFLTVATTFQKDPQSYLAVQISGVADGSREAFLIFKERSDFSIFDIVFISHLGQSSARLPLHIISCSLRFLRLLGGQTASLRQFAPGLTGQSQIVLDLSTHLASALAEATAFFKRVALL